MAGAGFKTFTAGSILTASEVNTYLMEQSTMVFATTTARDAAITAPSEGMQCYITDTNRQMFYDGSAWRDTQTQTRSHGVVATRASGTVNITDSTTTAVAFTAEDYDTDSYHDNSTNNTRFTVPSGLGGLYYIEGSVKWTAQTGATGGALVFLRLNGTSNLARQVMFPAPINDTMTVRTFHPLAATDYVELCVWHSSSGTKTIGFESTITALEQKSPLFRMWLVSGDVAP